MTMPGLKDRVATAAYSLGWSLVCRLPETWAANAFQFFADLAWHRQGPKVQTLEANLVRVLGRDVDGRELRTVSRAAMRSYGRYWLEVFRLPVMPVQKLIEGMHTEGPFDKAFEMLASGRGIIFALPHMGNWDQAGAWMVAQGPSSVTAVVERLKPESVYEKFVGFREGLGMEVLPATGGARPFGYLAQRLRAGGIVVLVADRDMTGSGQEVEFFGEKTKMMAGSAALAIQTGAALMPVVLWFDGPGWGVRIGDEIPVPATGTRKEQRAAMTQEVARFFEEGIREHPADWHMLQPVFLSDLDIDGRAAARTRAELNGQDIGEELL
jgi:phosphatidylinositol dimannoside acyltransferase